MAEELIHWLLQGDPAIRYQVYRDLLEADEKIVQLERGRIAVQGWGRRILKRQNNDGRWDRSLYTHKWTSTTYTLQLLRQIGLEPKHPQALAGCRVLLESGFFQDNGINFYPKRRHHSETCVTGMVLAILAYFGYPDSRTSLLVDHLLQQQMPDGGWNCERPRGATHGSFHTTISVLESLHEFGKAYPGSKQLAIIKSAQDRAWAFLLQHQLYRSHRTGNVVDSRMTRFSFPPQWHFDILRGLDHWQSARRAWDDRLNDAFAVLLKKADRNGRWPLQNRYPGRYYFHMEKLSVASRWNTLRALRVLKWRDRALGTADHI